MERQVFEALTSLIEAVGQAAREMSGINSPALVAVEGLVVVNDLGGGHVVLLQ